MKVLKSATVKKVKKEKIPKEKKEKTVLKLKSTSADPIYNIKTTNKEKFLKEGDPEYVDDFETQKELRSIGIQRKNILSTGEELIPTEFGEIKKEKDELKLLKYQIERNDGNVNEFLLSKYSSGEFNKAVYDGYDNSLIRLESGLEFEYHVYFPLRLDINGNDYFSGKRPASFMVKTNALLDRKTNDLYVYHFPVHLYDNFNYATDFTNELIPVIDNKSNGLIAALNILSEHLKNDNPNLPDQVFTILNSNGFIDDKNKLHLDIKDVLVEKYFKAVKSGKKQSSVEYLNKTMTPSTDVVVETVPTTPIASIIPPITTVVPKIINKTLTINTSIPQIDYTSNLPSDKKYDLDLNSYDLKNKNGINITNLKDGVSSILRSLKEVGYSLNQLYETKKSGSYKETQRIVLLLNNISDPNDKQAIVLFFTAGAARLISFEQIQNISKIAYDEQQLNLSQGIIKNPSNLKDFMNYIQAKGLINYVSKLELGGKGGFVEKKI